MKRFGYTHEDGTPYSAIETLSAIGDKRSAGMWMSFDDKRRAREFSGTEEEAEALLAELERNADSNYGFWLRYQ